MLAAGKRGIEPDKVSLGRCMAPSFNCLLLFGKSRTFRCFWLAPLADFLPRPSQVNAVAVAAAAATKTLCIVSRGSSPARERIAGSKRLGRACAIMLEECSYVRLRQLFPGLGAVEAGGQQRSRKDRNSASC